MTAAGETSWSVAAYFRAMTSDEMTDQLVEEDYGLVCRTDFTVPGFCLLGLDETTSSLSLRRFMVSLKQRLQAVHQLKRSRDLAFLSAARFDQQTTTKLHRDGGPDECFLMLGYEPSAVESEVILADYSQCARDLGLTPAEFLETHNPMFGSGAELLRRYSTRVERFAHRSHQVLLVNNSAASLSSNRQTWQGVLHTATVHNPNDAERRVVNSMMVASVPLGTQEPVSIAEKDDFLTTTVVRRRGYDRQHLADDL